MQEVVQINLDNEMDLILAHKRTMKLAEMCGLSLPSQTTFATAVSEIARCAISFGKNAYLVLGINTVRANKKEIIACLVNSVDLTCTNAEAFSYAKRLMGDIHSSEKEGRYEIRLKHAINFGGTISAAKIESFKDYFKHEPPLSPYDEIRKKNIQLIDLAERLQQSENQYRVLTDTLPLMMFAINPNGQITYSNKGLRDFTGQTSQEVTSTTWQSMVHPEDYKKIWRDWDKSMLNYTVFRGQGRLKEKSKNHYIWHLISIVPVKSDSVVKTWIGFFVDIHAQKLVEETLKDNKELKSAKQELEQYQQKLEEKIKELNLTNHDLEQFAYIASHDLQEPLRKIKTFSLLLQKDLASGNSDSAYFGKIVSSADRMSNLIKDVLNYSRLSNTAGQFVEVDLTTILENVKIDLEMLIKEKQAFIHNSPLPVITGIPLQLTQLFSNIINNSIKFSKDNPVINISAELTEGQDVTQVPGIDPSKKYWLLVFRDNGIGFEQQYSSLIFTIFQRLNDKHSYPGTGIGLSLCKKIVENHHGAIAAESQLGQGAAFFICLPQL